MKNNYIKIVLTFALMGQSLCAMNQEPTKESLKSAIEENNFYKILHVDYDATKNDIKSAYNKLSLLFHPDRYPTSAKKLKELGFEDVAVSAEAFKKIGIAYAELSDPENKAAYDKRNAKRIAQDRARKKREAEEARKKHEKALKIEEEKRKSGRLPRIHTPLEEWQIIEEYGPSENESFENSELGPEWEVATDSDIEDEDEDWEFVDVPV